MLHLPVYSCSLKRPSAKVKGDAVGGCSALFRVDRIPVKRIKVVRKCCSPIFLSCVVLKVVLVSREFNAYVYANGSPLLLLCSLCGCA